MFDVQPLRPPAPSRLKSLSAPLLDAEVAVRIERDASFVFSKTPPASRSNAATNATFTIAAGQRDPIGGGLAVLHDGKLPRGDDFPPENLFFAAGSEGGRIVIDLGRDIDVSQVNTNSRHRAARAPQVYALYGSAGKAADFDAAPAAGIDPANAGWTLIAKVDTRLDGEAPGGACSVSIANPPGTLGRFRHPSPCFRATASPDRREATLTRRSRNQKGRATVSFRGADAGGFPICPPRWSPPQ